MSAPSSSDMAAAPVLRLGRGMGSARWRASRALLISLLAHALLLSLALGGEGLGLPGLNLPWKERRAQEPDLQVLLEAPPAVAPPMPSAAATVEAAVQAPGDSGDAQTMPAADTAPAPSTASLHADSSDSDLAASTRPEPALIAMPRTDTASWAVPATPVAAASAATITPAASTAGPQPAAAAPTAPRDDGAQAAVQLQARMDLRAWERALERAELERARQEARQQAEQQEQARQEAARIEAARLEAERQEALKQAAARAELQRQEAARQEAARAEAARLEVQRQAAAREEAVAAAARQETARQEAARQEAARAEAARQEAERLEAARQTAARQEAARAEAGRQEAERQEALRQAAARQEAARQAAAAEAAKLAAAQAELEKREARLRAIGRQLNEEADRRAAASTLRRGRLFGRSDANAEMLLYAEAWARKIQLNAGIETLGDALRQPYTDPMVTVAIRSDGSVEAVSFVRSSGVPALDEAIRSVVQGQANYPAFQPALAREYDVIEIRRTWHFDMAIRLY